MISHNTINQLFTKEYQRKKTEVKTLSFSNNTYQPLDFDYTYFNKKEIKHTNKSKGLAVGEDISNFTVTDNRGNRQELYELLSKGKVIIIFYRGQWCPFCMPFLRKIQTQLLEFYVRGASVLLVTPEKQERIQTTLSKTETTIPIIYDEDYKLMNLFDVSFKPSRAERLMCNLMLRANLKNSHSDRSQTLPIPATFIINQNRKIQWRHFDKNFKLRASIREIIKNL